MNTQRMMLTLAAAGLATSASAQGFGDVLFTANDRNGGSDTIALLDYANLTENTLVTFAPGPESTNRLVGGIARDASGNFYVANSPFPNQDPSIASVLQVQGMFSGAPVVNTFASSDPIQNVERMVYDPFTNNVLAANNPGSEFTSQRMEAILGIDVNTAGVSVVRQQPPNSDPRPRDFAYNIIKQDRGTANSYIVGAVDGGVDSDPNIDPSMNNEASLLNRLTMNNPNDPTDISYELIVDLSPSVTGLSDVLSFVRGVASAPNGNLYITEERTRSIYEVELDNNGDYVSIAKILDLDTANGGTRFQPKDIIYNEFTGKLNYIAQNIDTAGLERDILEINLDGTGNTTLLFDTDATQLFAVPAPSAFALLGLGGLAAARRRR